MPIFDYGQLAADIPHVVRAMDNIHDNTTFPLQEQADESASKRRMGIGYTGLANAGEIMGMPYASEAFLEFTNKVGEFIRDEIYDASIDLAKEKGAFPLFDAEKYCSGQFIKTLPKRIRNRIRKHGIRNSHLLSIAPTFLLLLLGPLAFLQTILVVALSLLLGIIMTVESRRLMGK